MVRMETYSSKKAQDVEIIDLAKAIHIVLNKKEKIKIIGSRHGEKLNETLISNEEMVMTKETKIIILLKR